MAYQYTKLHGETKIGNTGAQNGGMEMLRRSWERRMQSRTGDGEGF
jgi:hypothetical protein